jgi:hypothetical protein
MMKAKGVITLSILLWSTVSVFAQNEEDALRYGRQLTPSSGRSWGMGGAMGALGADLSSFFTNPAGIGMYKRGNAEMSLGLTDVRSNAAYMGQQSTDFSTRLELNSFGIVGGQKENDKGISFNFGVAHVKSNQFAERVRIEGLTTNSSILDVFSGQAGSIQSDLLANELPFGAGAAYSVGAIKPSDDSLFYFPSAQGEVQQMKNIVRRGNTSITAFGLGMGIKDKLYLGLVINFHGSRFTQNSDHRETYQSDQAIQEFTYSDDLTSDGTGFSMRLGAILKPSKWLRVGAAIQTPTVITIREAWNVNTTSQSNVNGPEAYSSPTLVTDYNLRIPARYMANMAFVLGKSGVVSTDYEYINYRSLRMDGTGINNTYDYAAENNIIDKNFRGSHKVSAGMEWRLPYHIYLRAGASYTQSPYFKEFVDQPATISYHGGIGYRQDHWFVDFGLASFRTQQTLYLYDPSIASPSSISNSNVRAILGAGLRF